MGPGYTVMSQDLEPTPDEFRALPLESRHLLSMRPEVFLQDGLILRTREGSTHLIVPVSLRHRFFDITHSGPTAGHLGVDRTFKQLRDSFFWPGMRRDIAHWYRQCPQCATSKGSPLRPHGKLQSIPVGAPLDLVTIDILSGLPTASDGSKYLLVAVDAFTKWVEAYPLPDQEAHTCMTALFNGFFARFGLPRQLHSDQGRNFESSLVKELCEIVGVNKTRKTPFHPRSDGLTERANRTILQMLRATTSQNPQEWPSKIPSILSAYRMTEHSTTRASPNRAMLGREVLLPASLIAAPPEEIKPSVPYNIQFQNNLRKAHQQARDALGASACTMKTYFDRRVRGQALRVGQTVWLYWSRPLVKQKHRKLTQLWTGPCVVERFFSPTVVEISHPLARKRQTVHVDRL